MLSSPMFFHLFQVRQLAILSIGESKVSDRLEGQNFCYDVMRQWMQRKETKWF